jgi:hypothetical protein
MADPKDTRHERRRVTIRIASRVRAFLDAHIAHALEHNDEADPYEPYVVRCTDCGESLTVSVSFGPDAESTKH